MTMPSIARTAESSDRVFEYRSVSLPLFDASQSELAALLIAEVPVRVYVTTLFASSAHI